MSKAYLINYRVKLVKESGGMYDIEKKINNQKAAYEAIKVVTGIQDEAQEVFGVITLDAKNKITSIQEIARGTINSCIIHPREIFKAACLHNAIGVILFHNHPSGNPDPSREDKELTRRVVEAGGIMGIEIIDHIIVGDGCFVSMKEKGVI